MLKSLIKIICVCGARPNFIKIAPLMRSFEATSRFQTLLVHTGQHYDKNMSKLFFEELNIPKPDINLEVGSASHAIQTAEIMRGFEPIVLDFKPHYVLVVGDVNSTIACGLVAVKLNISLIHVEAGLRSFDRSMPEEINRLLTDSISDLLFVTEQSALDNLQREGVHANKVHFVGNVMIDTLRANQKKAQASDVLERLALARGQYGVITLHRPSNADDLGKFAEIITAFEQIEKELTLVFPIHPRTKNNLAGTELAERMEKMKNLQLIEPIGYLDFLCLLSNSVLVMTDSGGIQEEATILGIPCMTLRNNTERPVTIQEGTNRLVPVRASDILRIYHDISESSVENHRIPKFWDGAAAERIAQTIIAQHNGQR